MGNIVSHLHSDAPTVSHLSLAYTNGFIELPDDDANTNLLRKWEAARGIINFAVEGAPTYVKNGDHLIRYEQVEVTCTLVSKLGFLVCFGKRADFDFTDRYFPNDHKHLFLAVKLDPTLHLLMVMHSNVDEYLQEVPRPERQNERITNHFPKDLAREAVEFSVVPIPALLPFETSHPDMEKVELADGTFKKGIPLYDDDHTGCNSLKDKTVPEFLEELTILTASESGLTKLFHEVRDTLREVVSLDQIDHLNDCYLFVY